MGISRSEATPGLIFAVRVVLAEIAEIIEDYPGCVIVGGTVPYMLIPQKIEAHEGTVDIDVALDYPLFVGQPELTLHEVLERRLFQQDTHHPFRYTKGLMLDGKYFEILVELLAGGTPSQNGLVFLNNEDVYLSVIEGMEVAFEHPVICAIPGFDHNALSVASIPAFFAMKTLALLRREESKKSKDAYDIIYCLRNYLGGTTAIAIEYGNALESPRIWEGVARLTLLFNNINAAGPTAYSTYRKNNDQRELLKREAYERVQDLLRKLREV